MAVAQLVESRIVIPVVVGSSPISHPKNFSRALCENMRHGFFFGTADTCHARSINIFIRSAHQPFVIYVATPIAFARDSFVMNGWPIRSIVGIK